MSAKIYALYKGEELIDTGTLYQLARRANIQVKTMAYYKTPTYQKRNGGKNHRQLVLLDEGDGS